MPKRLIVVHLYRHSWDDMLCGRGCAENIASASLAWYLVQAYSPLCPDSERICKSCAKKINPLEQLAETAL